MITFSTDGVRGRYARTGAGTWSYTRTDRTLCQAIQGQGLIVALFELKATAIRSPRSTQAPVPAVDPVPG